MQIVHKPVAYNVNQITFPYIHLNKQRKQMMYSSGFKRRFKAYIWLVIMALKKKKNTLHGLTLFSSGLSAHLSKSASCLSQFRLEMKASWGKHQYLHKDTSTAEPMCVVYKIKAARCRSEDRRCLKPAALPCPVHGADVRRYFPLYTCIPAIPASVHYDWSVVPRILS